MILYIGQFKLFLSRLLTLFFFIHAPLLSSSGSIFLNSSPSITHSSSATSRLPYRWSFFGKGAELPWTGVEGILPLGLGRGSSRFRGTYMYVWRGKRCHFLLLCFLVLCPFSLLSPSLSASTSFLLSLSLSLSLSCPPPQLMIFIKFANPLFTCPPSFIAP